MPMPDQGGCWFCYEDSGPMYFSTEFDTNFHFACLANRMINRSEHEDPEARIIAREFNVTEEDLIEMYAEPD